MPLRLFIALWPDEAAATELLAWANSAQALCGGRIMQASDMHLTLSFLGSASQQQANELAKEVTSWDVDVRTFKLQQFGYFERAKVVWAGPTAHDDKVWLTSIYSKLWRRLNSLNWYTNESVFTPHVSLLRKAQKADLSGLTMPPVLCDVSSCVLVASQPTMNQTNYRVLAQLPIKKQ